MGGGGRKFIWLTAGGGGGGAEPSRSIKKHKFYYFKSLSIQVSQPTYFSGPHAIDVFLDTIFTSVDTLCLVKNIFNVDCIETHINTRMFTLAVRLLK